MPEYFDFEVSLRGIKPRIWRRFLLAKTAKFVHLHEAIQDAGGWYNGHLFTFQDASGEPIAGLPNDEGLGEPEPDALTVRVDSFFGMEMANSCRYEYDFGDGWELNVVLKGIVSLPEKFARKLLGGQRSFPPEDCGGIGGYQDCVRVALGKKKDEELLEWLNGWQPEGFASKEMENLFFARTLTLSGHYDLMS